MNKLSTIPSSAKEQIFNLRTNICS